MRPSNLIIVWNDTSTNHTECTTIFALSRGLLLLNQAVIILLRSTNTNWSLNLNPLLANQSTITFHWTHCQLRQVVHVLIILVDNQCWAFPCYSTWNHIHVKNLFILLCWLWGTLVYSCSFYLRSRSVTWHVSVIRKSTSELALVTCYIYRASWRLVTLILCKLLLLRLINHFHIFIIIIVLLFTLLTCGEIANDHVISIWVLRPQNNIGVSTRCSVKIVAHIILLAL